MSKKLLAVAALFALVSVPAMAQPFPGQIVAGGDNTIVAGRAHVYETTAGTYIVIQTPSAVGQVAGLVPWSDRSTFPGLDELDGRTVQISGVIGMDGFPLITMTDPDQLQVIG